MVYLKIEFGFGSRNKKGMKTAPQYETLGWDFIRSEIEVVKKKGSYKTASNYLTAARSWTKFLGRENWMFSEMDASLLEQYQRWLAGQGICLNTISAYMRALRVMYHRAMMAALSSEEYNVCDKREDPFRKVFTGRAKTSKRSLTESDLLKLHQLQLPQGSTLSLARDLFLFSFYAMGMPFVDIAYLKRSNLKNGYILYARHKTGQPIRVAILPPMEELLQRYQRMDSDYVFPILSDSSPEACHQQYLCHLRKYNYSLHRLSAMIGSSRPLSSYVVRHTWASIAYQHHVDIGLISRALGHTKTSTTLLYIKSLFDTDLAAINQTLMKDIGL